MVLVTRVDFWSTFEDVIVGSNEVVVLEKGAWMTVVVDAGATLGETVVVFAKGPFRVEDVNDDDDDDLPVDTPVDRVTVAVVRYTPDEDLVEETGVDLGTVVVGTTDVTVTVELGSPCVDADEDFEEDEVVQDDDDL